MRSRLHSRLKQPPIWRHVGTDDDGEAMLCRQSDFKALLRAEGLRNAPTSRPDSPAVRAAAAKRERRRLKRLEVAR